jgi:uncharacterized phiE125 gp8 family phage protein
MQLSVLTTVITEPVLKADVKAFMGFPSADTSQDTTIDAMIIAAREWLEQRTGLSIVSKSYKVYFEEDDAEDGWFELPVSPVLATPAITVAMNGVSTTFQQMGLKRIKIMPDSVFGTILVGASTNPSYVEVVFQAGATNGTANLCLLKIVSSMFNYREDGIGVNIARLPFDTVSLINSLSTNY